MLRTTKKHEKQSAWSQFKKPTKMKPVGKRAKGRRWSNSLNLACFCSCLLPRSVEGQEYVQLLCQTGCIFWVSEIFYFFQGPEGLSICFKQRLTLVVMMIEGRELILSKKNDIFIAYLGQFWCVWQMKWKVFILSLPTYFSTCPIVFLENSRRLWTKMITIIFFCS